MAALSRHYPPYEGEEPYLYFAFAEADSEKAGPLLAQLYVRGCRVWYGRGKNRSHRLEREKKCFTVCRLYEQQCHGRCR